MTEAKLIKEAREWVAECMWREDPEELDELTDAQIKRGVNRHYDGGWSGFIRDMQS
jgi:hypothetical protein